MVRFFLTIYDFLQQRRRLCLGLLAAVIGILLVMVSSLKYNENIYDFLPVSGNEQKAITLYQEHHGPLPFQFFGRIQPGTRGALPLWRR